MVYPAFIYLPNVSNRNIRTRCKICSKLTIGTSEQRQCGRSGVFIVNFEHLLHLVQRQQVKKRFFSGTLKLEFKTFYTLWL